MPIKYKMSHTNNKYRCLDKKGAGNDISSSRALLYKKNSITINDVVIPALKEFLNIPRKKKKSTVVAMSATAIGLIIIAASN